MAAVTRRGILGVIASVPLLSLSTPGIGSPVSAAWTARLRTYQRTRLEFLRACAADNDGEMSVTCIANEHAFNALVDEPSPDLASLVQKLAVMDDEYDGDEVQGHHFKLIARDARALAGQVV
jgi:hypothetical protein